MANVLCLFFCQCFCTYNYFIFIRTLFFFVAMLSHVWPRTMLFAIHEKSKHEMLICHFFSGYTGPSISFFLSFSSLCFSFSRWGYSSFNRFHTPYELVCSFACVSIAFIQTNALAIIIARFYALWCASTATRYNFDQNTRKVIELRNSTSIRCEVNEK